MLSASDIEVDDDDSDDSEDGNAAAAPLYDVLQSGKMVGLSMLEIYFSCPVTKCNNVKLLSKLMSKESDDPRIKLFCSSHEGTVGVDSANKCAVGRFLVEQTDGSLVTLSAFTPILREILDAASIEVPSFLNREGLHTALVRALPMILKYKARNGVIQSIIVKHGL